MITVYEKPGHCPNCKTVKAQLTNLGIEYDVDLIGEDMLKIARKRGWTSAPIVIDYDNPELSFCGNDWLAVEKLANAHKER